jgi:hypothetical protein
VLVSVAVDYLLYKICIATLQFGILECHICGLTKFLMSTAEVGLETFPSFANFRSAVPCCYVVLETPRLVENDVSLCDHLT